MFRPAGLDRLSLSLGAYAGVFVSAGLLVTTGTDVTNPVVIVAGLVTLVAVTVYTGRRPDVGERLSASRGHLALLSVPAVLGLAIALRVSVGGDFLTAAPLAGFLAFGTILPAIVVYVTAENRRARRLRETDPVIEWTAPPPSAYARRWKAIYIAVGSLLILCGVVLSYTIGFDIAFFAALGGGVIAQVMSVGRTLTFEVFEDALVVDAGGVGVKVLPWSRFTGYSLDDDHLQLHRRIPGTSLHCSLSDVEERDEIPDTLAAYLDART